MAEYNFGKNATKIHKIRGKSAAKISKFRQNSANMSGFALFQRRKSKKSTFFAVFAEKTKKWVRDAPDFYEKT